MQPVCGPLFVVPPVGRPQPQDLPAKTTEGFFADLVPVASSGRPVIGRAVAFNTGQECPRLVRVNNAKINPKARDAYLQNGGPTLRI